MGDSKCQLCFTKPLRIIHFTGHLQDISPGLHTDQGNPCTLKPKTTAVPWRSELFYQTGHTNFVPGWAQVDGHVSSSPAVTHIVPQCIPSWISSGRIWRTNAAVGSLCRSQSRSCWGLWIESEREWLTTTSPTENTARSAGRTTEKITLGSAYAKFGFYLATNRKAMQRRLLSSHVWCIHHSKFTARANAQVLHCTDTPAVRNSGCWAYRRTWHSLNMIKKKPSAGATATSLKNTWGYCWAPSMLTVQLGRKSSEFSYWKTWSKGYSSLVPAC